MLKKNFLKYIILAVLVTGGLFYFFGTKKDQDSASTEYTYGQVEKGNVINSISEVGEIEVVGSVDITASVSGVVRGLSVSNGDYVYEGQTLFTVIQEADAAF